MDESTKRPTTCELLARLREKHKASRKTMHPSTVPPTSRLHHRVPRIHASNRTGILKCMLNNEPYLLTGPVTERWGVMKHCKTGDASELEGVSQALVERFGDDKEVPVVICSANSSYDKPLLRVKAKSTTERIGVFLRALQASPHEGGDHGASARYLKDFHFAKEVLGPPGNLYSVPWAFKDDWLQWWFQCGAAPDDYRFLYAGSDKTWTPMHHDVIFSNSWSINLVGRKRWILFHPRFTSALHSQPGGALVADVRHLLARHAQEYGEMVSEVGSLSEGRELDEKISENGLTGALRDAIVLDQEPGEALFVPSGWHHQVRLFAWVNTDTALLHLLHNEVTPCFLLVTRWKTLSPRSA